MSELTTTSLRRLLKESKPRTYPKGQILIYAGDQPANVFILKSGVIKLYDIDDAGNEKIIHLIRPLAVYPAILLFGDVASTCQYFYSALTDCEIYAIPRTHFKRQLSHDSKLASYCVRWFASEMHDIMQRISSLERSEAQDKLLAALKMLAQNYSHKSKLGWRRVDFPVSHQLLAELTGVTRESITMAMGRLESERLVRAPKQSILEISRKLADT